MGVCSMCDVLFAVVREREMDWGAGRMNGRETSAEGACDACGCKDSLGPLHGGSAKSWVMGLWRSKPGVWLAASCGFRGLESGKHLSSSAVVQHCMPIVR